MTATTGRIVDQVERKQIEVKPRRLELVPKLGHDPLVSRVKGRLRVQCSCGAQLMFPPDTPIDVVEESWYMHRDGARE